MKYLSNLSSLLRWCLTLAIAISLSSCEKESDEPPFQEVAYERFAGQLFEKEVVPEEDIQKALREFEIESLEQLVSNEDSPYAKFKREIERLFPYLKLMPQYNIHGIAYHTVDPNGNPVVASGVVYYPKRMKPKGVVLISPVFKTKGKCGTDIQLAYEAFPGLTGYVCIVPDGIGLGSTAHLPIAFMHHENMARICVDMLLAAKEFIHNRYRYDIPQETFLFGYSQGGSDIWAVARHCQQHPEVGFKASDIFVGGGAYQPDLAMESLLGHDNNNYAVTPYIIWSLNQYENLGLDFTKIFKGKLLEGMPGTCNGEKSVYWLTSYLGTNVHEYMEEDFLRYKENPQALLILEALKRHTIPNDWIPEAQVHLYHGAADSIIPTACGDQLNDYLQSVNAKVTYHKLEQNHFECAVSMALDFFNFLRKKK
ncbi:MAG: lipase family protein [Prevotella sp.]|nr:hypothetical protein [Prevotella sp.]MDY6131647.1 lipase family protein [Prevotella sp.]